MVGELREQVAWFAVQEVYAGASYYKCDGAMIVTNSEFTRAAKRQAEGCEPNVILWDRYRMREILKGMARYGQ